MVNWKGKKKIKLHPIAILVLSMFLFVIAIFILSCEWFDFTNETRLMMAVACLAFGTVAKAFYYHRKEKVRYGR